MANPQPLRSPKTVVFVGLMGVGKTCIGKRLAQRLELPFIDADKEIEEAARCTIPEFFERYGEQQFREGERRVILRPPTPCMCCRLAAAPSWIRRPARDPRARHLHLVACRSRLMLWRCRVATTAPLLQVADPRR